MKYCPKCNKEYANGNFCESCENPDGSPVRLLEKVEQPAMTNSGMNVGGKVITGGDFNSTVNNIQNTTDNSVHNNQTYHNEQINNTTNNTSNITNTTNIHYTDDTKKAVTCHVCGKNIVITNAYTCKKCGQITCSDCISTGEKVCFHCATQKHNVQEVSNVVLEFQRGIQYVAKDKRCEYITSYIVPNNKSDIYSFIIYGLSQFRGLSKYEEQPERDAWGHKIISIYEQAEMAFGSDSNFMKEIRGPRKFIEKFFKKKHFGMLLPFIIVIGIPLFIVSTCTISRTMAEMSMSKPNCIPAEKVKFEGVLGNYCKVTDDGLTVKYIRRDGDRYYCDISFGVESSYDFSRAKQKAYESALQTLKIEPSQVSSKSFYDNYVKFNSKSGGWDKLDTIFDMKKNSRIYFVFSLRGTSKEIKSLMEAENMVISYKPYYCITIKQGENDFDYYRITLDELTKYDF